MVEIYFNVQSDNGSITDQNALRQWSTRFMGSLEDTKDLRVGTRLKSLLTGAGLVDVDARMIPLPLCAWSSGKCHMSVSTISGRFSKARPQTKECEKSAWPIARILNGFFRPWRSTHLLNDCICHKNNSKRWWIEPHKKQTLLD